MSDQLEFNLQIDLPDVVETPYRFQITCGGTTCDVYEHGYRGSGDWAAWLASGGHIIGKGGRTGYTLEMALADAHEFVRKEERSRLAHAQLRQSLATVEEKS